MMLTSYNWFPYHMIPYQCAKHSNTNTVIESTSSKEATFKSQSVETPKWKNNKYPKTHTKKETEEILN